MLVTGLAQLGRGRMHYAWIVLAVMFSATLAGLGSQPSRWEWPFCPTADLAGMSPTASRAHVRPPGRAYPFAVNQDLMLQCERWAAGICSSLRPVQTIWMPMQNSKKADNRTTTLLPCSPSAAIVGSAKR